MLITDTIHFVDKMATLPQSADPHLEQQGILITMPNHQQLHIHNIYIYKMIANKFDYQFTPPPIRLTDDKSKRQLKRQFHQLPLIGTPSFMPADTKEAVRLAKSSTDIGPDGMSTLHLKKLAHGAIDYLTNIINLN